MANVTTYFPTTGHVMTKVPPATIAIRDTFDYAQLTVYRNGVPIWSLDIDPNSENVPIGINEFSVPIITSPAGTVISVLVYLDLDNTPYTLTLDNPIQAQTMSLKLNFTEDENPRPFLTFVTGNHPLGFSRLEYIEQAVTPTQDSALLGAMM